MYLYHNFFNHSSVDGHLGCFRVLGLVNSAAVNIGIQVSFSIMVSSGYMPSNVTAESYGNFVASFLRNLEPIIQSEVSQNEKYCILTHIYGYTHTHIYIYIHMHIYGIYKDDTDESIYRAAVEIET